MNERTLLASGSPITKSIEAVKSLLAYVGRASDPLPTFLELPGERIVLVPKAKWPGGFNGPVDSEAV